MGCPRMILIGEPSLGSISLLMSKRHKTIHNDDNFCLEITGVTSTETLLEGVREPLLLYSDNLEALCSTQPARPNQRLEGINFDLEYFACTDCWTCS